MLGPDSGEKISLINWGCKEKVVHLSRWKFNMYSYIFPLAKKEKESDLTNSPQNNNSGIWLPFKRQF